MPKMSINAPSPKTCTGARLPKMHRCTSNKDKHHKHKIDCRQRKIVFRRHKDLVNLQIRGGENPCGYASMLQKIYISFLFSKFFSDLLSIYFEEKS